MESDNETLADVLKEFLDLANGTYEEDGWKYNYHIDNYEAIRKLNRIEAAHKRELAAKDAEIAELRECLKAAVEREGSRKMCYPRCAPKIECRACEITKWRKALEGGQDAR